MMLCFESEIYTGSLYVSVMDWIYVFISSGYEWVLSEILFSQHACNSCGNIMKISTT